MASATPPAYVHIEALQTAVPTRVVAPGRTRPVAVREPPLPASALQRRFRVVLYYRAGADGAAAPSWGEEALLVKESLSEAVADHPEMAGRLRRRADGSWEVKLNDTGVRLVMATSEAAVEEFVGAADRDRARREAALAPWTDVNPEDPDMCALCFMQLTRFQGDGGYAVGVSCSLMLSDPLSLARFLLSWARTHAAMKAKNKLAPNPMMQYAGYFQRPEAMTRRVKSVPLDAPAAADAGVETVLFRAAAVGAPDHRALARACVEQASERLGAGKVPRFSVVVVDGDGDGNAGGMSVETCAADEQQVSGGGEHKLEVAQWQELGLGELVLRESKPVHVSCSIVTGGDEGLVVVMPDGDGFLVTATVSK
ncbi:hypothetical protein ACP70R_026531 [Stipagrostis hirtigluma subsp. patula]